MTTMIIKDKITLIEMLNSISEDHPELEERLKKMGGVKNLAVHLGTDLSYGIHSNERKERVTLFGM